MTDTAAQQRNLATVRRHLIDAWQEGGFDGFETMFNADFVDHNPMPGFAGDVAGMRRTAEMIKTAFPVHEYEVVRMIPIGDLVLNHWIFRGRNTGPMMDAPPTNHDVEFCGIDIMRLVDGRISETWHVEELHRLSAQLRP